MLPETVQYRRDNADLTASFVTAWGRLWPALDMAAVDSSFPRWLVSAATLTGRYRSASALLAVDYLRNFSAFPAAPGGLLEPARFTAAMRVATVVAVKLATRNGLSLTEAAALAFSVSSGSGSRLVLEGGRSTITQTTAADPSMRGWQRVGDGGCDFCQMLLSRGAVYTEASADFPAHDRCHCSAEPVAL